MSEKASEKEIALVTGGSRGIGAEICKALTQKGFHVLINFSSREEKAKEVLDQITKNGGSGDLLGMNVGDPDQVDEKFKWIQQTFGRLDALINNAGMTVDSLLLRLKNEDLDRVLDINLKGAIYCTRSAAKMMMKARKGSIVQISSVVGEMGNPGQSAYTASKAGLIGFSKSVARELASRGIRVNVVTPGFIQTDMTESLTPDQKEAILRSIPLGDMGKPQDVAQAVAFLVSDDSAYVTGQVLGVNGGLYM